MQSWKTLSIHLFSRNKMIKLNALIEEMSHVVVFSTLHARHFLYPFYSQYPTLDWLGSKAHWNAQNIPRELKTTAQPSVQHHPAGIWCFIMTQMHWQWEDSLQGSHTKNHSHLRNHFFCIMPKFAVMTLMHKRQECMITKADFVSAHRGNKHASLFDFYSVK